MRSLLYVLVGILFGIILYKSEASSWFRIYEMFRFDSFHMYGIIGSALVLGALFIAWVKRSKTKSFFGDTIQIKDKDPSFARYAIGGVLFGLGWALAGACPGPMYILIGAGYWSILIVLVGALVGALIYGIFRNRLPH